MKKRDILKERKSAEEVEENREDIISIVGTFVGPCLDPFAFYMAQGPRIPGPLVYGSPTLPVYSQRDPGLAGASSVHDYPVPARVPGFEKVWNPRRYSDRVRSAWPAQMMKIFPRGTKLARALSP